MKSFFHELVIYTGEKGIPTVAKKKIIRCTGPVHESGQGNILIAIEGNSVYVRCHDRACKRWSKITFNLLSDTLDFAGKVQEVLPEDINLDTKLAATVVARSDKTTPHPRRLRPGYRL